MDDLKKLLVMSYSIISKLKTSKDPNDPLLIDCIATMTRNLLINNLLKETNFTESKKSEFHHLSRAVSTCLGLAFNTNFDINQAHNIIEHSFDHIKFFLKDVSEQFQNDNQFTAVLNNGIAAINNTEESKFIIHNKIHSKIESLGLLCFVEKYIKKYNSQLPSSVEEEEKQNCETDKNKLEEFAKNFKNQEIITRRNSILLSKLHKTQNLKLTLESAIAECKSSPSDAEDNIYDFDIR